MMIRSLEERISKVRIERGSPDDLFVAKLAQVKLEAAKALNQEARDNVFFQNRIKRTLASGGWTNYVQICAPYELYALTRLIRPKHIVEVGVSAGVSSAYFLLALHLNGDGGVLHSIDLPEKMGPNDSAEDKRWGSWELPRGKGSGWAIPRSLKKGWDLRLGMSSDVLPDLARELKRVDLFLYDVPYEIEDAIEDFRVVDRKLSKKKAVALADNCLVPISWWARRRGRATLCNRKNSGLRGFHV